MKILFILLLSFCAHTQTYLLADSINNFNNIDTTGLVSYWRLTNPGDSTDIDPSSLGNDLTGAGWSADFADELTGTDVNVSGGNSLNFNGSSEYFNRADDNDYDFGTGDFTVTAWVSTGNTTSFDWIVGKGSTAGWNLGQHNDGTIRTWVGGSVQTGNTNIGTTNWHFVILTRSSGSVSTYVDNAVDINAVSMAGDVTTTTELSVGEWSGTGGAADFWAGVMSEITVYSRALSAKERAELWALPQKWKSKMVMSYDCQIQPFA